MAGLLDSLFATPSDQALWALGSGLLGVRRGNEGRALMGGMAAYNDAQQQQRRNALTDAALEETKAQAAQRLAAVEELKRKALLQSQGMDYLTSGGSRPAGSTIMRPETMQQGPQLDPLTLIKFFGPDAAQKIMESPNWGRAEVARTLETEDDKGAKITQQFDRFGNPVGQGVRGYVPPVQVDRGSSVDFVKPAPGVSLSKGYSPSDRISLGNLDLARQRLAFDMTKPEKPSATQEKADLDRQAKGRQSQQLMAGITKARELLGQGPTASGIGTGVDWMAQQFGTSFDSTEKAAQLETLSGWLTANVPRMEGPQSNYDVENYRIMAARVGNSKLPVSVRLAALQTLEDLQTKYAEINGTPIESQGGGGSSWGSGTVKDFNSLPKRGKNGR